MRREENRFHSRFPFKEDSIASRRILSLLSFRYESGVVEDSVTRFRIPMQITAESFLDRGSTNDDYLDRVRRNFTRFWQRLVGKWHGRSILHLVTPFGSQRASIVCHDAQSWIRWKTRSRLLRDRVLSFLKVCSVFLSWS